MLDRAGHVGGAESGLLGDILETDRRDFRPLRKRLGLDGGAVATHHALRDAGRGRAERRQYREKEDVREGFHLARARLRFLCCSTGFTELWERGPSLVLSALLAIDPRQQNSATEDCLAQEQWLVRDARAPLRTRPASEAERRADSAFRPCPDGFPEPRVSATPARRIDPAWPAHSRQYHSEAQRRPLRRIQPAPVPFDRLKETHCRLSVASHALAGYCQVRGARRQWTDGIPPASASTLSTRDHQPCRLAVPSVHSRLSRCRGSSR